MDYSKIYINLIERSFTRNLSGYTEKHHIIPKCMDGDDLPRNISILTPEEHYLAHVLLCKIYPNNKKLYSACSLMVGKNSSNKEYGWIKRKLSILMTGANNPMYGKRGKECHNYGIIRSEETRRKMSNSKLGIKAPKYVGQKISKALTGLITGERHHMFGKFSSENPNAKRISQYLKTGEHIKDWNSMADVRRELNIDTSSIVKVCKGKEKSAGGYIWKYLN